MANTKEPHYANGKICYLEIPAIDIAVSAAFYQLVFDWQIRRVVMVPFLLPMAQIR